MRRLIVPSLFAMFLGAPLMAQVATSEAPDFVGDWTLAMEMQGRSIEMTLAITDEAGQLAASLGSQRAPEPTRIEQISRDGETLNLSWKRDMQGQEMVLNMALQVTADGLAGTFGDESGFFSTEVTGTRPAVAGDIDGDGLEDEGVAAGGDGDGDGDGDSAPPRRRAGESTVLESAAGKVQLSYHPLAVGSVDWQTFVQLKAGEVFSYVGGRSIKLLSVPTLDFGGTRVEAGNASPTYPGVYSVWLRKTADGWSLIFNHDGDIWGSQRLPERDAVEVALAHSPADQPSKTLSINLIQAAGGGTLRIAWGEHQWMAPFTAVPAG